MLAAISIAFVSLADFSPVISDFSPVISDFSPVISVIHSVFTSLALL